MARNVKSKLTLQDKIIGYIVNRKYGTRLYFEVIKKNFYLSDKSLWLKNIISQLSYQGFN